MAAPAARYTTGLRTGNTIQQVAGASRDNGRNHPLPQDGRRQRQLGGNHDDRHADHEPKRKPTNSRCDFGVVGQHVGVSLLKTGAEGLHGGSIGQFPASIGAPLEPGCRITNRPTNRDQGHNDLADHRRAAH